MSNHAIKWKQKEGVRRPREGARGRREGDPEAPDPERDPTNMLHMRVQLHSWMLVSDYFWNNRLTSTAATTAATHGPIALVHS